ncbi:MAG: protein kinase [Clostridia bacterium]
MLENGTVISNKYIIDGFLGSGGMSNVYKAHEKVGGRLVAIKILRDEYQDDAEFMRRFEREAKSALSLSHDNIVKSYDVGMDGGMHYIVLEYIDGLTLKEYITKNGALSQRRAVHIASQVLDALSAAHESGLIHRDVKPQNVLITKNGTAKLTDFGIARDTTASTKTFTGNKIMGSVHYISPEQAKGDEVTERSDIYSAGIMFYEMLTGEVPFNGDSSVSVALMHVNTPIVAPREKRKDISIALNDVILKAASKNPENRYESAKDMEDDLRRALREPEGNFVKLTDESRERRGFFSKNGALKIAILTGALVIAAIITLIAVSGGYQLNRTLVPKLIGKTVSGATGTASDFTIIVDGWIVSDEYGDGYIISQDPEPGMRAPLGSTIKVTVSRGSETVPVPNLTGLTLQAAADEITKVGLNVGKIDYQETDAPKDKIYKQNPEAKEIVGRGTPVDIYISGKPSDNVKMPSLVGLPLKEAVETLRLQGLSNVRVFYSTSNGSGDVGSVVKQNINANMEISREFCIELMVYGTNNGAYTADRAYNIPIDENDSLVIITILTSKGYELVQFNARMTPGTQVASFTAHYDEEGEFQCVIYINGVEYKRDTLRFSIPR